MNLTDTERLRWLTIRRNSKAGLMSTLPEVEFLVELVERALKLGDSAAQED